MGRRPNLPWTDLGDGERAGLDRDGSPLRVDADDRAEVSEL
jgi:hypothetical protein